MINGIIRLKWRENRQTKYYYTNSLELLLKKLQIISNVPTARLAVFWNGKWHPCHTIFDVKVDLKRILKRKGGF